MPTNFNFYTNTLAISFENPPKGKKKGEPMKTDFAMEGNSEYLQLP